MESGTGSGVVSCIPAREHQSSRGSTPPAPKLHPVFAVSVIVRWLWYSLVHYTA